MSPDVNARQRERLEAAGWKLVELRSGKSLWTRAGALRFYTLSSALKHVDRQEREELEAAGWEAVEGKRETFWRRPDSGYLYAQQAAIAVVQRAGEGGAS